MAESEPGRRVRKKQQTRAALSSAALRLVAERGLDHVTVEEISAAVDVSARTFFNYFATKDEAVVGFSLTGADRVRAHIEAAPAGLSARDAVLAALRAEAELLQADPELSLLRMTVIANNPSLLPRLIEGGAAAECALTETIAGRLGTDPHTDGFPFLVAAVTGAAFRVAMTRWGQMNGARPLTELLDEAFVSLAAGLTDPPA